MISGLWIVDGASKRKRWRLLLGLKEILEGEDDEESYNRKVSPRMCCDGRASTGPSMPWARGSGAVPRSNLYKGENNTEKER